MPTLVFMNCDHIERMAMSADKQGRPAQARRTPPRQPDYQDEISKEQLEAIRQLADPDGSNARGRVLVYPEAW